MASAAPLSPDAARSNLRVGLMAFAGALAMLGLGYASVPLYRLFCQVTGFGGTTMIASESKAASAARAATGQKISIRFDGTTAMGMPWTFHPSQTTDTVTIGERDIATYVARNNSEQTITGVATFNVTPEQAGKYFNKVQCFCFNKQTLQPGQEVRMPVVYFVDPKIAEDPDAKDIEQITLSYTFHPVAEDAAKALDRAGSGG